MTSWPNIEPNLELPKQNCRPPMKLSCRLLLPTRPRRPLQATNLSMALDQ